jgi:uncharacterized protein
VCNCLFVSDLHGHKSRYEKLFSKIESEFPDVVFIGGDFLPNIFSTDDIDELDCFISDFFVPRLTLLKSKINSRYPLILIIFGNDDPKIEETKILEAEKLKLLHYLNNKRISFNGYDFYGYSYVPPSPFLLKDWEKYDISRYVEPGSVSPEDGFTTIAVSSEEKKNSTIKDDLAKLAGENDLSKAVFLFHSPPYQTGLDKLRLKNSHFEDMPVDPHVGSIAIEKFIKERKPMLTLHGHIHESAVVTGKWKEIINDTCCINGSHEGDELALIRFSLSNPCAAERELL